MDRLLKPTLSLKTDVRLDISNLDPDSIAILRAALITAPPTIDDVVVVTSASDSVHSVNSMHYIGRAFDLRCFGDRPGGLRDPSGGDVTERVQRDLAELWTRRLGVFLSSDYDVILESDHIHVEHDPILKS